MSESEIAELKAILYPDLEKNWKGGFYRPEPVRTFENLKFVRPSVLYVFGEISPLSAIDSRADKLTNTGIGLGGSGGVKKGRVKDVVIKDTGHLIPMEKGSLETARSCSDWIASQGADMDTAGGMKRCWDATPDEQSTPSKEDGMFGPIQQEKHDRAQRYRGHVARRLVFTDY